MQTQTTFVNGVNPFTSLTSKARIFTPQVPKPAKNKVAFTDPLALLVCDDPLPKHRASPGFKYNPLFKKMKIGQCVKCQPDEVGRVSGALKKWIEVNGKKGAVKTIKNYGDGLGRVWWIEGVIQKRVKS